MLLTLPNILTLSRVAVIPVFMALFFLESATGQWIACAVFTLAGITDFFDGYLARSRGQMSAFGTFLDPVADKLLVAAALLMMVGFGQIADLAMIPAVIILCREILVSGLREFLAELRVSVPVSQLAKWKTAGQLVAIGFLIAGEAGQQVLPITIEIGITLLWLSAIVTLYTGWDYLRAGLRYMIDQ